MTRLSFVAHGTPATKGSMKPVRRAGTGRILLVESHKTSRPWRLEVRRAAERAVADLRREGLTFTTLVGPVSVDVEYGFRKPKSAPKTVRTWPVTRSSGDLDKLHRNVLDALVDAAVIGDDSQVVELTGRKDYAGPGQPLLLPGALVVVKPLGVPA